MCGGSGVNVEGGGGKICIIIVKENGFEKQNQSMILKLKRILYRGQQFVDFSQNSGYNFGIFCI